MNRLVILFCFIGLFTHAQVQEPKLVVGIVVDQMRFDYLNRYWNDFGEGGFKRLVKEGYNCTNTHFNYIPTYTGPGHASIFFSNHPFFTWNYCQLLV